MAKPPTKGGAELPLHTKPTTISTYHTRSVTQATETSKPSSRQKPTKPTTGGEQVNRITTTSIALFRPIVEALNWILDGEDSTKVITDIFAYIRETEKTEREDRERKEMQEEVSALRKAIKKDLGGLYEGLSAQLNGIVDTLNVMLENSEKVLKTSEELKGETNDILSKIGKVMNVTDKIANTTQSYRDVLVARQTPSFKDSVDPKVLGDMDQRAKQILVDIFDGEGENTLDKSLTELLSKANEALDKMSDADKPEKVKVESVLKAKKNAVLLTLNSKEAAIWIREPGNEETFANAFSKGAHIREREYNLVAPRVPLTFEPSNPKHLREIEEANALPAHIIRKARWIKPAARRRAGQTHAYAILSIASVDIANKLIKDGIGICSSLIRPQKLKQEPTQCMKCRRWGHFAEKCPESVDTCGTCGDKHRTSTCNSKDKRYCVSCGNNSHASWDRNCPEFIKRCAHIDERNPNNSMQFFPAEQDWTFATRPNRIPLADRFPAAYAVNSLPLAGARNAQCRKGPNPAGNPPQGNPNLIPVPANNRFGTKEPGVLANDEEGIPEWLREPIPPLTEQGNSNGDVTQQPPEWI